MAIPRRRHGSRPTVDTVAVPAMRCIASSILYSQILQPFYPINTDFNGDGCFEGLMQLWSSVAEQESQEVMGRWRSIAYRAVRHPQADDDDFLENMAKQLLTSLRDVMVLLLPQRLSASRDWEQLIGSLMPHALEVLRKANDFQSITQGQCVSWDYMVYHPPSNRTFHGDTMDVDTEVLEDHAVILERHPVDESRLLLATSLGLQAHRKTMDLQETIVVQKAKAVAARSSTS
ncbi:hypothetical protein BKA62DRAFT_163360 [Auriculariales sp. MPI-PUGE-AT-0066]|nr:hypothetical protein BKA62DRAFT_163360 [Auriculariales sp. MPI-PUGE-AT-0066]